MVIACRYFTSYIRRLVLKSRSFVAKGAVWGAIVSAHRKKHSPRRIMHSSPMQTLRLATMIPSSIGHLPCRHRGSQAALAP